MSQALVVMADQALEGVVTERLAMERRRQEAAVEAALAPFRQTLAKLRAKGIDPNDAPRLLRDVARRLESEEDKATLHRAADLFERQLDTIAALRARLDRIQGQVLAR